MNAIRRDETTDNIHSIFVDQWDWEKVIEREDRNEEYLKDTVRQVYRALRKTEKVPVKKKLIEKTVSNIKEVKSRGAMVVLICAKDADVEEEIADILIRLPECDELLMPMAAAVPLQLIAYYTAVHKGCDVDKPRNLAKSVTVE